MRIALRLNLDGSDAEYCPVMEMSRGMQRIHDRIVRRFSARKNLTGSTAAIVPKLRAGITVNGCEFKNVTQMPPEYRRFYEEILAQAVPMERAVDIVTRAEHSNYIKRTTTLVFIAVGCIAAIVYLWLHGYYA
jgi:hypothetical protein